MCIIQNSQTQTAEANTQVQEGPSAIYTEF